MSANAFSEFFTFALNSAGISGRELARRMGIPEASPGHWKNGRNPPTTEQAEKAAEILGLEGTDRENWLVLSALQHIPDDGARSRVQGVYNGFKDLELRLHALELRLKKPGKR